MTRSIAKRWVFTINNYTTEDVNGIQAFAALSVVEYLVFGREVGANGTRHLQGYICFSTRKTLAFLKREFNRRGHFEVARGSAKQASDYCKKDGDFDEYGTLPGDVHSKGGPQLLQEVIGWIDAFIEEYGKRPTDLDIAKAHPVGYAQYHRGIIQYVETVTPAPKLRNGELLSWQSELRDGLLADADDRTIKFFVDPVGNTGKTWFQQWFLTQYPSVTQILGCGKRDDMAYAVDENKSVFLLNVPRGSMEHLQYSVLEMLKDRIIFSPKYGSRTKYITSNVHVVVFCNEMPDMNKLSPDRYDIEMLSEPFGH